MNNKVKVQLSLFIVLAGLLLIASCKKDQALFSLNYDYNYYPLDSGHYVIYDVDSILYSYVPAYEGATYGVYTRDTVNYQLMEVIGDTFYDNQNRINYMLVYYRRPDSTYSWNYYQTWYAYRSTVNLQVVEQDIRFIKLVFPPQMNESWLGNAYVPIVNNSSDPYYVYQGWNYFYENLDTTYNFNGAIANNTLIVSEINQENLLNKTVRTEAYAQGIGLVYQKWEALSKQNVILGWDSGAENGFSIEMKMWSHYP